MKLKERSAIISGASMGLGFEIAKQFIHEGAHVMLCARNHEPLKHAQKILQKFANKTTRVEAMATDVSQLNAVNDLVEATLSAFGKIDILVANAGVYGTKGPLDEIDWEEWSQAIDINLKGSVIQCKSVLKHFKANRYGKIILLSGGGATKPMPYFSAYAASKAAIVRFAETLAEEVKDFRIDVNALAPGALNTRFLDEALAAGKEKIGDTYYKQCIKQKNEGGESFTPAAKLCTFLASRDSDGLTGKLISAIWDPWEKIPEVLTELNDSDVYTLRRILPIDRGKTWSLKK